MKCDGGTPCGSCKKSPLRLRCVYTHHHHKNNNNDSNNKNNNSNNNNNNNQNQNVDLNMDQSHSGSSETPTQIDQGRFGRMRHGSITLFSPSQSIMKPVIHETAQDMGLFSFLQDDSEANFADYFGFSADSSNANINRESRTWSGSTLSDAGASSLFGSISSQAGDQHRQLPWTSPLDSKPHLAVESSVSEHENHWYNAFGRCETLQFLFRGLDSRASNEGMHLSPEQESVRPLVESFARLDQLVQSERESRARPCLSLLSWPQSAMMGTARDVLPPRTICDVLLDTYVNTFESVLRILHVPSFLRDYECFWDNSNARSIDADWAFACKLLAAIAIGSCICPSQDPQSDAERAPGASLQEQASDWIAHSRQWLARRMLAGSRANLDMAQILCLLALARHTQHHHATSTGATWLPEDHDLTRIAIHMGLHREPRIHCPDMSIQEAEIRRRLWATMLELSLQQCLDGGLPAPLAPESYDCEPPSSITDEDLELGVKSPKCSSLTPSTVLMLLARTQQLRLRSLQLVNAPGASKAYEDSHRSAAELNVACCADFDMLRSMSNPRPTNFQIKLLGLFTRPFVFALHAPFADQATAKPAYYYSRRMRMEFSALLLARNEEAEQANDSTPNATDPDANATLLIRGHGHFALVQRQATAALCVDLISELEDNAFPTLDGGSRQKLHDALNHSVSVFEQRVRASGGAHSTHEYLFFASAQAYIDTMLRRSDNVDQAIANRARAALAMCCEAMESSRQVGWTTPVRPPANAYTSAGGEGEGEGVEDVQLSGLGVDFIAGIMQDLQ
jgi:hypothetical protein